MKNKPKKSDIFLIIFITATVIFVSIFTYKMYSNTGEKAISKMTQEEISLLEKISTIDANTTSEEVFNLLGQPTQDVILMAKWNYIGGSILNQGRVYFSPDGTARKFRLIKLGSFFYEKRF